MAESDYSLPYFGWVCSQCGLVHWASETDCRCGERRSEKVGLDTVETMDCDS